MATSEPVEFRLDDAVRMALADPEWTDRCERDVAWVHLLLDRAHAVALEAFENEDDLASDEAHRALYLLHAQGAWSPIDAPRFNQHDPTLLAVLSVLERGFEAQLSRVPLPEEPPGNPDEFRTWLQDLALEYEVGSPSGMGAYLRDEITLEQLKEIVAQRSLFFLKEPDPWAMVIPSLHGEAKAGLLDLLLDEYGWGRYDQMHSTVYEVLLDRLSLETGYDAYFDQTAWQFLAGLNYQGMLARHRRLCRRMYGYIYLVEADSPRSMQNYLAAWRRLGIDDPEIVKFYDLHVTADEGHQAVALDEVIGPVVRDEPQAAPEIARGVVEGHFVHALFAHYLVTAFRAGHSALVPA